jgi:hypothetical protein
MFERMEQGRCDAVVSQIHIVEQLRARTPPSPFVCSLVPVGEPVVSLRVGIPVVEPWSGGSLYQGITYHIDAALAEQDWLAGFRPQPNCQAAGVADNRSMTEQDMSGALVLLALFLVAGILVSTSERTVAESAVSVSGLEALTSKLEAMMALLGARRAEVFEEEEAAPTTARHGADQQENGPMGPTGQELFNVLQRIESALGEMKRHAAQTSSPSERAHSESCAAVHSTSSSHVSSTLQTSSKGLSSSASLQRIKIRTRVRARGP